MNSRVEPFLCFYFLSQRKRRSRSDPRKRERSKGQTQTKSEVVYASLASEKYDEIRKGFGSIRYDVIQFV